VNVAGGNITTYQTTTGLSAAEIKQLFDEIYTKIESGAETSSADKEDLRAHLDLMVDQELTVKRPTAIGLTMTARLGWT